MRAPFALAVVVVLAATPARAQQTNETEPLGVDYTAPDGCPGAASFFGEITARTPRARAPQAGERARVLHVRITRRGETHAGTLAIEDTTGTGSAREVSGGTCAEVVGALAIIAALAVDPRASIAPRPPPEPASTPTEPAAATPASTTVPVTPVVTTTPEKDQRPAIPAPPSPSDTRPRRVRFGVGAGAEVAMIADAVGSGRVFADLEIARDERELFAPAFRVFVARSLDRDVDSPLAAATLRWTQGGLDVCPLRIALGTDFALRPCVSGSGGVLDAESIRARSRPWATLGAHGRAVWAPAALSGLLGLELEGGILAPLVRESFFFEPSVPVYEPPAVAFVGRFAVSLRFP